ncbi:HAD family hydrolase [Paraburkholderia caballeronis]|uniref:Haloacid dehalogenase superfamily, subfamily IA, variant 3 with third motif having DD or ED n=1 Tax=Paraburkholderia caballeronis TaxID=416943 RepID=A0A1H7PR79_9BURK|nr:HAD family phosphatase [Paraburkholderia caballeronis]PXW24288.1 HAD superfamily hydrolase (TIGR01509 family) [Paraburkholderia caballeronis]PXX00070.1 HAD superfamily hydrolase (TIGR01509 family) [Paraburkholderia caballeronis]RAJ97199.1 HAD superfamily hydrolase (TIGR01509 family) [Paraburkholderia caballeronis]TDV08337.1 HAD superfamily hydrolase (TIGR01509 family) [Paraburkholderia caballeronis]TDV12029.1 HAD superfamily hydrolase (TIGR01509 family) [Paraburkholderia caballeronis]
MTGATGANTAVIRALICDCDGVLIDSEAVAARVLVAELEARWPGAQVGPVVMPLLGQRIERVLAGAAAELGRTLGADDVAAIRAVAESSAMEAPLFPGVAEALGAIALTKACASNSYTAVVRQVLDRTGLVAFFGDRVYCADLVERPKPAPDVYLAAARGLGVEPAACVVVEDSVAGVTAAHAAGMTVLGFVGGSHIGHAHALALRDAGASDVFDQMDALPELIAQRMRNAAVGSH